MTNIEPLTEEIKSTLYFGLISKAFSIFRFVITRSVMAIYVSFTFAGIALGMLLTEAPIELIELAFRIMLWPLILEGLNPLSFSLDNADFTTLAGGWLVAITLLSAALHLLRIRIRFRYILATHCTAIILSALASTLFAPQSGLVGAAFIIGAGVIGLVALGFLQLVNLLFGIIGTIFTTPQQTQVIQATSSKQAFDKPNK